MAILVLGIAIALLHSSLAAGSSTQPHIIFIVADDLGWNDVSARDPSLHTPVLDKLAAEGVVLNQSYVQPVCSPSRAAFMSGLYPFHTGLQHKCIRATQKAYLPGSVETLPQRLQRLGYATHMMGKWHLGFCNWIYTPTYRGFDSFLGFYNAVQNYYTHVGHRNGYDFRQSKEVDFADNGTYSAFVFTQGAVQAINDHDVSKPLFIYLPYQSVHGPLQVPDSYAQKYCAHIKNETRRTKCGMIAILDEGVGNVTAALQKRGLYNNTLLLFSTDNGGPVHTGANNWPLRGSKATLWEGGTRAMAFLHAPNFLKKSGYTYNGLIHAVDWLPTFVEAAGGQPVTGLDGVSQWPNLVQGSVPSPRSEFVYNVDEINKNSALRMGQYKLIQGNPGKPDGWYPPPQIETSVDTTKIESFYAEQRKEILQKLVKYYGSNVTVHNFDKSAVHAAILRWRSETSAAVNKVYEEEESDLGSNKESNDLINDPQNLDVPIHAFLPFLDTLSPYIILLKEEANNDGQESADVEMLSAEDLENFQLFRKIVGLNAAELIATYDALADKDYQLYDLEADPLEHNDIKDKMPDIFNQLRNRLEELMKTGVPANFPPKDPDSDPKNFGGVWSPGWC